MEIYLELNQRLGAGYQIRIVHGPMDKTFDEEPLTLYEAGSYAGMLLEEVNRELHTHYEPHKVLRISNEGLEANAGRDLASAKMLRDIQSGRFQYSTPGGEDFKKTVIDGEEEHLFSGRGTVLVTYFCWLDDKNQLARAALRRYCEYICAHGFKGGVMKALSELDRLDKDRAVEWIRRTYARHVHDDAALIQYLLPERGGG